jgi:hypothetical protein
MNAIHSVVLILSMIMGVSFSKNSYSSSASSTSAQPTHGETHLNPYLYDDVYRHVARRKIKDGRIAGFHIYDCQDVDLTKKKSHWVCKLSDTESIIFTGEIDPNEPHGGYLFKEEKNLGWKSFFPRGWTRDDFTCHPHNLMRSTGLNFRVRHLGLLIQ